MAFSVSRRSLFSLLAGAPLLGAAASPAPAASPRDGRGRDVRGRDGRARATNRSGTTPPLPLVVLDPGHGGKDPGAVGVTGTYEKHVALAAAGELRRQLEAGGRCRVLLTRGRDSFIPLADRVGFAQRQGAALFVSLHADALADASVRGASVYTLSDTASDAQTAALARRENAVDRLDGSFRDVPPDVAHILSSLVRRETRAGSARLARGVVGSMGPAVGTIANPSRHAGFAVLKASDVPSVLVEMGFMSNKADEAALRRPEYRARVAAAVRQAVEGFLSGGNPAVHVASG